MLTFTTSGEIIQRSADLLWELWSIVPCSVTSPIPPPQQWWFWVRRLHLPEGERQTGDFRQPGLDCWQQQHTLWHCSKIPAGQGCHHQCKSLWGLRGCANANSVSWWLLTIRFVFQPSFRLKSTIIVLLALATPRHSDQVSSFCVCFCHWLLCSPPN